MRTYFDDVWKRSSQGEENKNQNDNSTKTLLVSHFPCRFSAYLEYWLVLVLSLVINIRIVITLDVEYPGNFWFSHVIWKRLECWNDRVFLYLKCVDCCLICSYHLNKAQVSEAPFSLYFKCFDSFWFSVMNHLENTQVSKAAALISTPHLRSPTPAGCPFVPPQKVFEDWTKIFLPLPVGICAPTKMYLCFFQKVFVTLLRHVIVRL